MNTTTSTLVIISSTIENPRSPRPARGGRRAWCWWVGRAIVSLSGPGRRGRVWRPSAPALEAAVGHGALVADRRARHRHGLAGPVVAVRAVLAGRGDGVRPGGVAARRGVGEVVGVRPVTEAGGVERPLGVLLEIGRASCRERV